MAGGDCHFILGRVDPTDLTVSQAGAMARGSTYQVEPMIAQVMRCVFEFRVLAWYLEIHGVASWMILVIKCVYFHGPDFVLVTSTGTIWYPS